jgi:hypothetical protein
MFDARALQQQRTRSGRDVVEIDRLLAERAKETRRASSAPQWLQQSDTPGWLPAYNDELVLPWPRYEAVRIADSPRPRSTCV